MIIVLKNADFSQSNIGTLSTWRISRSLGAGATYEGPTSVDKNAALSATVTLAEDYEIGPAGVTVTMGGTVLSGAHSISGNVITITIVEVTGNVLIKVPTINTATGEEEEPDVPVEPVITQVECTWVDGVYVELNTGAEVATEKTSKWTCTEPVSVQFNETYLYTGTTALGDAAAAIYGYDASENPVIQILGLVDGTTNAIEFTIPSGVSYIKVCSFMGNPIGSITYKLEKITY